MSERVRFLSTFKCWNLCYGVENINRYNNWGASKWQVTNIKEILSLLGCIGSHIHTCANTCVCPLCSKLEYLTFLTRKLWKIVNKNACQRLMLEIFFFECFWYFHCNMTMCILSFFCLILYPDIAINKITKILVEWKRSSHDIVFRHELLFHAYADYNALQVLEHLNWRMCYTMCDSNDPIAIAEEINLT